MLSHAIPASYLAPDYYRSHSPAAAWQALRGEPALGTATDAEVWDAVAFIWTKNASPPAVEMGAALYAANCAACHGETGHGDGVYSASLAAATGGNMGLGTQKPSSFTDAAQMLGASPALLQGKIIRGGMGTGMPSWGAIFTEDQTWALVAYLYSFQMEVQP